MKDNWTSVPSEHQPLRGEAPPGLYYFVDETGAPVIGGEGIIPILELIDGHSYQFIGTGFFITSFGVFATAKHILTAARPSNHQICVWQFVPPDHWLIRPVIQIKCHNIADLAVGVPYLAVNPETAEPLWNARVRLTTREPAIGDRVSTYAYPNTVIKEIEQGQILSFQPRFYEGQIVESFPHGRDSVMLPGPCFRTSMVIHHGASGGPVAGPSGRVCAVNSTGIDGTDDSYVSRIDELLSLTVVVTDDDGGEQQKTIEQLATEGFVTIDP